MFDNLFGCVRSIDKIAWDGPKWGREGTSIFLANPDLADIFGDMDLDFEIFHF